MKDVAADVVMEERPDNQKEEESQGGGIVPSSLAKFKAAQDLRIQTDNLPAVKASGKPATCSSLSSSAKTSSKSSSATSATPKTPIPPCSTGKKRRRRTAAQIDRKFACTYPGCTKAYGSEGSLTQHQRLKHRNQAVSDPNVPNPQIGNFFLPLHRSAAGHVPGAFRSNPMATRTVSIRPATMEVMPIQFDVQSPPLVSEHEVTGEFGVGASRSINSRPPLRARSNSMPISFPGPASLSQYPLPVPGSEIPRPQSVRKNGRAATAPRQRHPLRRNKCRSKSESLTEIELVIPNEDIQPPKNDRSLSDSVGFDACNALVWALPPGQSASPPSSSDDAIDSDILSVLADYDTSDAEDPMELISPEAIENFASAVGVGQHGDDLSPHGVKEEWVTNPDAMYLSTHLEKMTMLQETADGDQVMDPVKEEPKTVDKDGLPELYPDMSIERIPEMQLSPMDNIHTLDLPKPNQPLGYPELEHVHNTSSTFTSQLMWTRDIQGTQVYTANDLDQGLYMDDIEIGSLDAHLWRSDKQHTSQTFAPFDPSFRGDKSSVNPILFGAMLEGDQAPVNAEAVSMKPTRPPRSGEQERLHNSYKDDRRYLQRMVGREQNERTERIEAIVELKSSIDKSSTQIQSQNAQLDRRAKKIADQEAADFQGLLNQGQNPYEVSRKRQVKEAASKEREKIEQRIQDKQSTILKHLEVEKVWMQRKERIAEEHRAYERKYQKEMGRAATEERTVQYLLSRTGKETLDPTGKAFRIYPSQETTLPDWSFGTGKNLVHDPAQRHAIVDKMHHKRGLRDAAPSPMLLPREPGSNNNANERIGSPGAAIDARQWKSATTTIPGQNMRDLNHSVVPDGGASKPTLPPIKKTGKSESREDGSSSKKGFGKPKRSVLEQRMLENAREKQKNNIFQKQVVWGKEFTGSAFLADPPELWFKDFDIGVPMAIDFTLTNVSNTFNHFKLLDCDESIREFFEVTYERPGRMSAGMSCRIKVAFTAIRAQDIETIMPALAQTGPFGIPVRCTCKKAVPVLQQRSLVFKEVIAGEKQVLSLTLENQGALHLDFRVRPVKTTTRTKTPINMERPEEDGGEEPEEPELMETEAVNPGPIEQAQITALDSSALQPSSSASSLPRDGDANHTEDAKGVDDASASADVAMSVDKVLSRSPAAEETKALELLSQRLPLSVEEARILEAAQASIVYKPDGADTPIRHTISGTVAPYSSAVISFTFMPAAPMNLENEVFMIHFPSATTTHASATWVSLLQSIPVTIQAQSSQVPMFVNPEVLDFRCCLYDRLYRHQLIVCNRGKVALKMQIRVPKALQDCVDFHPNMGFVQGASTTKSDTNPTSNPGIFPVQIKFRPHNSPEMWKRLVRKGLGDPEVGFIAIPIQIVVPDQVIPVYFILTARLSPAELTFSPRRLDFGRCALGHSVAQIVEVTNNSRLSQRLAFVKVPSDIRIENATNSSANPADDGFATLLPLETKTIRVIYQPGATTSLRGKLLCRSTFNEDYSLSVNGECASTPLAFSHSVVLLGATQLGQKQVSNVMCANTTEKPQTFELVLPVEAQEILQLTPTVATIPPRSSLRIEIEFDARETLLPAPQEDNQETETEKPAKPVGRDEVLVNHSAPEDLTPPVIPPVSGQSPPWSTDGVRREDRSIHHTWTVQCFIKSTSTSSPVALQIQTTVIDPKLFATPSTLEFGQVAIGQALVRELRFTNESAADVQLAAKALHVLGGFRMINSLQRKIARNGGERVVLMEFRPQAPLIYEDELEVACPEVGVVRVPLRGEGINPSLHIQPSDGIVDFKDVLARNQASMELQFTNSSAFPLGFKVLPLDNTSVPVTTSGLPVFTFLPSEGVIPAHGLLTIKASFLADHQRPEHYQQQYLIQVPNESERHILTLSARCWENQIYVFNLCDPPSMLAAPPVEDFFDVPPSVSLSSLLQGTNLVSLLAPPGIKKPSTLLTVVFDGESDGLTKTISIGSTLPPQAGDEAHHASKPAGGAPVGSFELTIEENQEKPHYAKLFTIEPLKGAVTSGQQIPIQLTYSPPAHTASSTEDEALTVAQWIQVKVTCTLRGGFLWRPMPTQAPPPVTGKSAASSTNTESEMRIVTLHLRAKMLT
ncbi:hypothetical protein Poli38472_010576 [Pythium oligandrum]|uniref:C2H2-type domain-containing protein n=1 Tax=Pythium oligandrum TaxID=41045 RepID=A0A8K1FCC4_PYTOL|nr:hypothetical protein Poli38472_010576 [Pythium oligandrum]|eukprot:TMW55694.1 hypothetical protein Poli38472_010576 [Pythium oligandrum]